MLRSRSAAFGRAVPGRKCSHCSRGSGPARGGGLLSPNGVPSCRPARVLSPTGRCRGLEGVAHGGRSGTDVTHQKMVPPTWDVRGWDLPAELVPPTGDSQVLCPPQLPRVPPTRGPQGGVRHPLPPGMWGHVAMLTWLLRVPGPQGWQAGGPSGGWPRRKVPGGQGWQAPVLWSRACPGGQGAQSPPVAAQRRQKEATPPSTLVTLTE